MSRSAVDLSIAVGIELRFSNCDTYKSTKAIKGTLEYLLEYRLWCEKCEEALTKYEICYADEFYCGRQLCSKCFDIEQRLSQIALDERMSVCKCGRRIITGQKRCHECEQNFLSLEWMNDKKLSYAKEQFEKSIENYALINNLRPLSDRM